MNSLGSKTSLTFLALLALFLFSFLAFDIYRVGVENEETARMLAEVNQRASERLVTESIRSWQGSVVQDVSAFEALTISPIRLVGVIESIEAAGRSLGLETSIASVEKSESQASSTPQIISLVVETSGSWSGTARFIKVIESLPTRVAIKELNLAKQGTVWDTRTTLDLYSFE